MKFMISILSLCLFATITATPSAFASADDIFLSQEQLQLLPIEEHVDYLYGMLDYFSAMEAVQDKALKAQSKDKNAYLNHIKNFIDLLPTAQAANGDVCMCGTYTGSAKGDTCNVIQKSAATGPYAKCGEKMFTCNENLYSIPNGKGGLDALCVKKTSGCAEMSNSCTKALKAKLDNLSDDQLAVDWANRTSRGISMTKNQVIVTNKTVVEYCKKNPSESDCQNFAAVEKRVKTYGVKVKTKQEMMTAAQKAYDANRDGPAPSNSKGLPDPKPLIPENGQAPVPSGDCISQKRTQLGALACVACGLESVDPEMSGGANEFVGLLGVVSQTYGGSLFNRNTGTPEFIQSDVIERLMSYGYCSDAEFGSGALADGQVRSIIDGQTPTKKRSFLFFKTQDKAVVNSAFAKFGIQGSSTKKWVAGAHARSLFGNSPRMSDSGSGGGSYQTHVQQVNFGALSRGHYKAYPNTKFSRCANALDQRNKRRKEFKMCQPRPKKKGLALDADSASANERMREAIYGACNLKPKRKKFTQSCERGCSGQYNAFGFSSTAGCEGHDHGGKTPGKGGENPGNRGGDTPGKSGENPGNRGGESQGKSAESSGDRGGGSQSGGGESAGNRGGGESGGKGGSESSGSR